MKIRIKLFSIFKDCFNSNEIELEFNSCCLTIQEIIQFLKMKYPKFSKIIQEVKPYILVNGNFVSEDYKVSENDEIAIIPQPSGG